MDMVKITVFSKENCVYCDQAKALFQRLQDEYPITVEIIDLNTIRNLLPKRPGSYIHRAFYWMMSHFRMVGRLSGSCEEKFNDV